jgi:hypothetical protein
VLGDLSTVGLVRQSFADLGQIILPSGIMHVGQEVDPLAGERTPLAQ